MKKLNKILMPILALSISVISGCHTRENSKTYLTFGDVHAQSYKNISIDQLNDLVAHQESFLLTINTESCGCWSQFSGKLSQYAKDFKVNCYQIGYSSFIELKPENRFGLNSISSGNVTFAIFNKGKLAKSINTDKNSDIMYKYDSFKKFMNENVILPKCYFINKDDVTNLKASDQTAVIYFERSGCGDCNALNPTLLDSYIKSHQDMNNIYVLDIEEYHALSSTSYQNFKDEVGISNVNNPTYGWNTGYVPFFSLISKGEYKSGCVIYNDSVTKVENKNIITSSYYTSERVKNLEYTSIVLEGKEIPESEMLDSYWPQKNANKYYEEILNSFLDYALPLVDYEI